MTDFHFIYSKLGAVNSTVFYLITGQEPFEHFECCYLGWLDDPEYRESLRDATFKVLMNMSSFKKFTIAFYRALCFMQDTPFTEEQLVSLTKKLNLPRGVPEHYLEVVRSYLNNEYDPFGRQMEKIICSNWLEADWFTDEYPEQQFVRVFNHSPIQGQKFTRISKVSTEFQCHGTQDWFDIGIDDDGMLVVREWYVYSDENGFHSSMVVLRMV